MLGLKNAKSITIFLILIVISFGIIITLFTSIFGEYSTKTDVIETKIINDTQVFTQRQLTFLEIFGQRILINEKREEVSFEDVEIYK